ncbi:MAG: phosphomethylpyrimidine synthase ThiC [Candidatus Omnitrophica bacterium]|nr:phosphomethylpyrimidine synthase ThiC [Candidatus Omnitrophota bacterium]
MNKKELAALAKSEEISLSALENGIKTNRIVVVKNPRGKKPLAIGEGCFVKINANIGTSPHRANIKEEMAKLKTNLPLGSVPIYSAAVEVTEKYNDVRKMSPETLWEKIEEEAAGGVSFVTVHTGVSEKIVRGLQKGTRLINIVSRGGSILACWMLANKKENPLLADFSRLLKLAKKYKLCLSLGDGLRPGTIADSTDCFQLEELFTLGQQAKEARKAGVSVIIEGPGHIPLHQIEMNVKLAKTVCDGAPLYLLGPLVTDIAPGYDHIVAAIGGAIAGMAGADFLCYVTPAEHLSLPTPEDVKEGVYASRIAAHAIDLSRGKKSAWRQDWLLSSARNKRNWPEQKKLSLNPDKFPKRKEKEEDCCSMCGDFCSMRFSESISKK